MRDLIEQIASQWDGCMYGSVGGDIDIGQAIRDAGKDLARPTAVEPSNRKLIDALDRYLRQDECAGDTDNGIYRQGQAAMSDALTSAPAETPPAAGAIDARELLRRSMGYVKEASTRYYDGTDGASMRASAASLLKKIEAALASREEAPEMRPVQASALAQSVAELDAWMDRADGEPLTPSESESVMLVLHELKRLRATPSATPLEVPAAAGAALAVARTDTTLLDIERAVKAYGNARACSAMDTATLKAELMCLIEAALKAAQPIEREDGK